MLRLIQGRKPKRKGKEMDHDTGLQKTVIKNQTARHLREKIEAIKYIIQSDLCDHNITEALRALQSDSLDYHIKE